MANLNITICDYCKGLQIVELPAKIIIQTGKGKNKEVFKADICSGCFDIFRAKVEERIDINKIPLNPQNGGGETIVPSRVDNIAEMDKVFANKCTHEHSSYDPPYVICKDCGEKWLA